MPSQAQKHVTHNEAIELLDALVQMVVTDLDLPTPPETPFEGQIVSVGEPAAEDFSGHEGQLACFYGGGWVFVSPREGYRAWVTSREGLFVHRGGTWVRYAGTDPDEPVTGVGINASWTEGNRLSVSSEGTLLSHEGGGHQVYVNKAAEAETASLVFQTAHSGRAEMGLAGNDDFAVKVSPDGSSWVTALSVEAATGRTVVGEIDAARLSGAALQETPHDTTPGRLMRADWGYGPGNVLGGVTLEEGRVAGALFERGGDARGSYVRTPDGRVEIVAPILIDTTLGGTQSFSLPTELTNTAHPLSVSNVGGSPNPALRMENIEMKRVVGSTILLRLKETFPASSDTNNDTLICLVNGYWY